MRDDIADVMWTIAFKIWDLPGLSHDRIIVVEDEHSLDFVPDTWIGRLAEHLARWLYDTAVKISTHKHMPDEYADGMLCFYDWDNDGITWLDEADQVSPSTFTKRLTAYYGE